MFIIQVTTRILLAIIFFNYCLCDQEIVDYIAKNVKLTYKVLNNFEPNGKFVGELTFLNEGDVDVNSKYGWDIFFSHMHRIDKPLDTDETNISHRNGYIHQISPKTSFTGFKVKTPYTVKFLCANWEIALTDVFPNWYVADASSESVKPKIITNTNTEDLRTFVADFDTPKQYKRILADRYTPWSVQRRYEILKSRSTTAEFLNDAASKYRIIPSPKQMLCDNYLSKVKIDKNWVVYTTDSNDITMETSTLKDYFNIGTVVNSRPTKPYIQVKMIAGRKGAYTYKSYLNEKVPHIDIEYSSNSGLFYAFTTMRSLSETSNLGRGNMPSCNIEDEPRFQYRGLMLDISRNFRSKSYISSLMKYMSKVKLNKLHLHLTDDEGWRLEIPGLPELTDIGAKRCHDLSRSRCVMPHLGSDPTSDGSTPGSGYISRKQYIQLLQEAKKFHIDIIPEIDIPGHSHAAILAMEARAKSKDGEFNISDPLDTSKYLSVQWFKDNAINPCLSSTYKFVGYVVEQIKLMHEEAQSPLSVFHFGGDETPAGAWVNSTACNNHDLHQSDQDSATFDGINRSKLMKYFVERVAEIVNNKGLDLAGWEDGFFGDHERVYNRSALSSRNVYAYAWNNIWEWGAGPRAYKLANAGYKTILAPGTNVYLDHPQEPDPQERGLYWATRFTDLERVFGYRAADIYKNIQVSRLGVPLDKEEICANNKCPKLTKPENIIGIQAELWSEVVRTDSQADSMLWPRLAAVAERAWKVASWENKKESWSEQRADFKSFTKSLTNYLLPIWDMENGPLYYLPPVGAKPCRCAPIVKALSAYQGLQIQYTMQNDTQWKNYPVSGIPYTPCENGVRIKFRTTGSRAHHKGREETLSIPSSGN